MITWNHIKYCDSCGSNKPEYTFTETYLGFMIENLVLCKRCWLEEINEYEE